MSDITIQSLRYPLASLLFSFAFSIFSFSSVGYSQDQVGVFQYNVKGSQGGWRKDSEQLHKRLEVIHTISALKPLDFVVLEEADEIAGHPTPSLSEQMMLIGQHGWSSIGSSCNRDATQIGYANNWILKLNLAASGEAQGWKTCEPGSDGRPYNIALFSNRDSAAQVLIVVSHFPHCRLDLEVCAQNWRLLDFRRQIAEARAAADSGHKLSVIAAGDFNEIAFNSSNERLGNLLNLQGVRKSKALLSCCEVDGWINRFDYILTDGDFLEDASIVPADYPLDKTLPSAHNEEHKAIYALIGLD